LPLAMSSKPVKQVKPINPARAASPQGRSVKNTNRNALKSSYFALSAVPNKFVSNALMMAVPKRLLKRAVDRNAVKRVCREAWRQNCALKPSTLDTASPLGDTKLVKLVSLPKFDSVSTLKSRIRTDLDFLFTQIK
jgi:Ribonuclease P